MTQERWNTLTLYEQLSNIDGEVTMLVRRKNDYETGITNTDYTPHYLEKIENLIRMTMLDPKNSSKEYRAVELYDELQAIRDYLDGKYPEDYILRYWKQYTDAIS